MSVVSFPSRSTERSFGLCPICMRQDGCITNAEREHWFVCELHKTKWRAGCNLFSVDADNEDLVANGYRLANYRAVEPHYPAPEDDAEQAPYVAPTGPEAPGWLRACDISSMEIAPCDPAAATARDAFTVR